MTVDKILSRLPVRMGALSLAALIIMATGAAAFLTGQGAVETRKWVIHSYAVRHELGRLEVARAEARAGAFQYSLSHDSGQIERLEEQFRRMEEMIGKLRTLVQDNPRQTARLQELQPLIEEQAGQLRECALQNACGTSPAAKSDFLEDVRERKSQIGTLIAAMDQEEEDLLPGRLKTWDTLFRRNLLTIVAALLIAALLVLYSFRLLSAEVAVRKEMEKLAVANAESYRALSARILELQDIERRKIARELHDSVGQYLAGLKMSLAQLSSGKAGASNSPDWLSETIDMTDRAIGEIRTISHLLHPPLLDELGFESTAKWYVQEFAKRSGTKVKLEIGEIVERLPRGIELALFRVLQESLTNVHRHARAETVEVWVTCTEGEVTLEVRDNGRGIPPRVLQKFQAGGAAGIGLAGMRERMAELGGTLEVESSASGSKVRATLPTVLCEADDAKSVAVFGASG